MLLAAREAVLAIYQGTAFHVNYVLWALALLTISVVMLQSNVFNKVTAYAGILANVLVFGLYVPTIGISLSIISVVFLLIWYILIAQDSSSYVVRHKTRKVTVILRESIIKDEEFIDRSVEHLRNFVRQFQRGVVIPLFHKKDGLSSHADLFFMRSSCFRLYRARSSFFLVLTLTCLFCKMPKKSGNEYKRTIIVRGRTLKEVIHCSSCPLPNRLKTVLSKNRKSYAQKAHLG